MKRYLNPAEVADLVLDVRYNREYNDDHTLVGQDPATGLIHLPEPDTEPEPATTWELDLWVIFKWTWRIGAVLAAMGGV